MSWMSIWMCVSYHAGSPCIIHIRISQYAVVPYASYPMLLSGCIVHWRAERPFSWVTTNKRSHTFKLTCGSCSISS